MNIPTPTELKAIAAELNKWLPSMQKFHDFCGEHSGTRISLLRRIVKGDAPLGFKLIGSGYYRAVFTHEAYPGVVFKVAYVGGWENQNREEVRAYKSMNPKQKYFVPKMLGYSEEFEIVVMELVKGVTYHNLSEEKKGALYSKLQKLRDDIFGYEAKGYTCYDFHHNNVMVTPRGRMYLIDCA